MQYATHFSHYALIWLCSLLLRMTGMVTLYKANHPKYGNLPVATGVNRP
jgi:hypothetical protein